jgi:hypothetical protein
VRALQQLQQNGNVENFHTVSTTAEGSGGGLVSVQGASANSQVSANVLATSPPVAERLGRPSSDV